MNFKLRYKEKELDIGDVTSLNSIGMFRGLMFRDTEKARALLFDFKKSKNARIHSFFVFLDFVAIYLDDENTVVDIKVVRPFTLSVSSKKSFSKLLEIPVNKKYSSVIEILVGRERFKKSFDIQ